MPAAQFCAQLQELVSSGHFRNQQIFSLLEFHSLFTMTCIPSILTFLMPAVKNKLFFYSLDKFVM